MNESEAKEKWCPFSRVSFLYGVGVASINRDGKSIPDGSKCLGNACACWVMDYSHGNGHGHCGLTYGHQI